MKKKVVIVTHSEDNECVRMVTEALNAKGAEAYRLDTDLFPTDVQISMSEDNQGKRHVLTVPDGEVNTDELTAVWYRRLKLGHKIPTTMDPKLRTPSINESRTTFLGFLESLDTFVFDRFQKIRYASNKQVQLQLARKVGLEIPRTLTTNKPDDVRAFFATCKTGMITKMQASFAVYEDNKEKVVFTNKVTEKDLEELDGLALCPMTFQENIPKKLELRVTITGNRVFAASIDSQSSNKAQHDWRRDGAGMVTEWQYYELPKEVETKLLKLMDGFGLNYGAVDFILTPDGKLVFLEINPGGEFFWLQTNAPHFPISEGIAEVLLGDAPRRI